MDEKLKKDRERVRKDLKKNLEYFSEFRKIELSQFESDYISKSVAYKINLLNPVFGHKGTT